MAPRETPTPTGVQAGEDEKQTIYIVRHGDRWDYENPEWAKTSPRPGDPPLSTLGHQQARETGMLLDSLLADDGIDASDITWLSSPFLRCLQTSNEAINAFKKTDPKAIQINPEYSVFEWDGKNGEWHASLPPIEERRHYFPRLNLGYQSMFIPEIPEPRTLFHARCERAISAINTRFPYRPRSVLVVVTHAAACIGLARAAANLTLADITPAAPCSVFRLTRSSSTPIWEIDAHDAPMSMNGHVGHLSDLGGNTVPWNHFGDKAVHRGYTGPLTSKFAPDALHGEL